MYVRIKDRLTKMTDDEYTSHMESLKTDEQKYLEEINDKKLYLSNSDFEAIKFAEGNPSKNWEEVKSKRAEARVRINELEELLMERQAEVNNES